MSSSGRSDVTKRPNVGRTQAMHSSTITVVMMMLGFFPLSVATLAALRRDLALQSRHWSSLGGGAHRSTSCLRNCRTW